MAIYHNTMKIVTRGKGKSAVAASAYQSGTKMVNEWDGEVHDYSRKKGVVYSEIMLPEHAPASFSDRSTLWNSLELFEKRGDAQLARSIEVSLPIELGFDEHLKIIHDYCEQFRSAGMVVDFSMHDPEPKGHNPHCHILLTMRPLDEKGHWAAKSKSVPVLDDNGEKIRLPSGKFKTKKVDLTGWSDQGNAEKWRASWAEIVNKYLEANGFSERIDHRSNETRGIEEIPQIHMGVAAWAMEKKGIPTERGEINRQIKTANRIIREIRDKINGLVDFVSALAEAIKEIREVMKSPKLADLVLAYMDLEEQRVQKYSPKFRINHQSEVFHQLEATLKRLASRKIYTLDDLENAIKERKDKNYATTHRVKDAEERMKELGKLIDNAECLMKYNPIKKELKGIKWTGKREKYAEDHRSELALWDAANRFLHAKNVDFPSLRASVKSWKSELATLQANHDTEYAQLKADREELKELESFRYQLDKVLEPARQEQQKHKKQNMEL